MEKVTPDPSNIYSDDTLHVAPFNDTNETSQSSPLLSYKLDKYRRFFHPISPHSLLQLVIPLKISSTHEALVQSPLISPFENELLKELKNFSIKEAVLSPSPLKRHQADKDKKPLSFLKKARNCFFSQKSDKELRKWWISSQLISVIGTTYHSSFKYFELSPANYDKCLYFYKKFPKCEDLSINIETFAELGPDATSLIRKIVNIRKMRKICDIRFVSFPGENTLWHGPAFLFNSVMGFNREDCCEGCQRLEIWHRFRSYFDRGAYQKELIEILSEINARFAKEKVTTLHLILASHLRLDDGIIDCLNASFEKYLRNLKEFKLFLSSCMISDKGLERLCGKIEEINPQALKSFHVFLDYRSKNISNIGILAIIKTILRIAEKNIVEFLSVGFLGNELKDQELAVIGEALRMVSKNLRSLVIIIAGNVTDAGIISLLDGVFEGNYLKKICLGFMGPGLKGEKSLRFLTEIMEKKAKNGNLQVFHLYFNNKKGVRNEEREREIKGRLEGCGEIETYLFC